jgi:hypothetical protein
MSALKEVFVRVHFRYDRDRYLRDLEDYASFSVTLALPPQCVTLVRTSI